MYIIKILFILLISFNVFAFPKIPNINTSPGHLCSIYDSDFFEYRYSENIPYCKRNVSSSLKSHIYDTYKIPLNERKDYTIDHIIPLSIGGSNDLKNLWPEHVNVKRTRPNLEVDVYSDLKNSVINQNQAINIILNEKFKSN